MSLIFTPTVAFAGGQKQRCKSSGESAVNACKQKHASNEAIDQMEGQAAAAASQPGVKTNGVTGNTRTAAQEARLRETLAKCEEEKKKCEQECEQAANTAGGDDNVTPALMPTPQGQDGESRGDVNGEKQNSCVAPMGAAMGDIGMALAALAAAAAAMMATQKKSEDDKPGENDPKTTDPKCEEADNYKKDVCTNDYIAKCTQDMSAKNCDAFSNLYCGAMSGTADQPVTNPGTGTDQVTGTFGPNSASNASSDVNSSPFTQGAGAGSEFCSMVARLNATKVFCQNSNNSSCPSCNQAAGGAAGFLNSTPEEMQAAQNTCGGDPVFKDPKVTAALSTLNSTASTGVDTSLGSGSGISTGADSTGTGGGALNNGDSMSLAGPAAFGAVNEGSGMKSWDMNVSGGGGGGGGSGYNPSSVDEATRDPAGLINKKTAVAAAVATGAKDIAQEFGPGPFSILTGAYQSLCTKGKLNCK